MNSIVLIDTNLSDYQTLIDGLAADTEYYLLDTGQDGIQQIAKILQGRQNLDSIQLFSHGSSGALYLGSTLLNHGNINHYAEQLAAIGASLSATGDILLYGCNVAQGEAGVQFIDRLAQYTGADVAASDDLTGHVRLGGDWELEASSSTIDVSALEITYYDNTLAIGMLIAGDQSGNGGAGGTGGTGGNAHSDAQGGNGGNGGKGSYGGNGGGDNDLLIGSDGNDVIFGDGSGGGSGGSGGGGGGGGGGWKVTHHDIWVLGIDVGDRYDYDAYSGGSGGTAASYSTSKGVGGAGSDTIYGGAGNDILFGDGFDGGNSEANAQNGFGGWGGWSGFHYNGAGGEGGDGGIGGAGGFGGGGGGFGGYGGHGGWGWWDVNFGAAVNGDIGPSGSAGAMGGNSTHGFGNTSWDAGAHGGAVQVSVYDYFGGYYDAAKIFLNAIAPGYAWNEPTGNNDVLNGGAGSDDLVGRGGNDTFVFEINDANNDTDTVWDFSEYFASYHLFGWNYSQEHDKLKLTINGEAINSSTLTQVLSTQTFNGNDRSIIFTDNAGKTVNIVVKNFGKDLTTTNFITGTSQFYKPPTVDALSASGNEDTAINIRLSGNDVDGAVVSFKVAGLPISGTLYSDAGLTQSITTATTINASGNAANLYFRPAIDWNGNTSFQYTAIDNDGQQSVNAVTASITVIAVNDAPIATANIASGDENTCITVSLSGSDVDGTVASFKVTVLPLNGTLYSDTELTQAIATSTSIAASGNAVFLYFKPDDDWNGNTSLQYISIDNNGLESVSSSVAAITVSAVNDAPTFTVGGDGKVTTDFDFSYDYGKSATVQGDGKILVAGSSNGDFALVRYHSDGSLDTSFGGDGKVTTDFGTSDAYGRSITVQTDDKILVAGGSGGDFVLARYNGDGSLDTNFDGDGKIATDLGSSYDDGYSVTVQADGKILVAGFNYDAFALVRYNSNGSLDTSFDGDGKVTTGGGNGSAVTVQADGKILMAGTSNVVLNNVALMRYSSDGALDTSFDGDGTVTTPVGSGNSYGKSVAVQVDGKILVAGTSQNDSNWDFTLVRYNSNGSLDAGFDGDGKVTADFGSTDDFGYSVTMQNDGKILMAGSSGGNFALVRYNGDGTLDANFDGDGKVTTDFGSANDLGYSVIMQSDGKILVIGGGNNDFAIARYNSNGSLDSTFDVVSTLNGVPHYIENGSAEVLDSTVQIYDANLAAQGHYNGATVTLARHGGANSQDTFSGSGNLGFSQGNALLSDVTIGTISNSGGTLTITFNSNATQAVVNEALSSLAYSNNSDNPPALVQIDWTLSDGNNGDQGTGGALTALGSTSVTITPVNDAPIAAQALTNQTIGKYTNFNYTIPANSFTDVDVTDTLTYMVTKADGAALPAWLSFDGVTRTFSGTPGQSNTGTFALKVTVTDNANASADSQFTLSVPSANVAPLFTGLDGTPLFTEGGAAVVLDESVSIYDADLAAQGHYNGASVTLARHGGSNTQDVFTGGGNLNLSGSNAVLSGVTIGTVSNIYGKLAITFNINATQARVNETLTSIAYSNHSYAPPTAAQIDWIFNDGNGGAQGSGLLLKAMGSTTVAISPIDFAPVLTTPAAINYTDTALDDRFQSISGRLTATDQDSSHLSYGIADGTHHSDGTISKQSAYGLLTVTEGSGTYRFTPNDAAIEPLTAIVAASFTITATDGVQTDSKLLSITISQNGSTESVDNDTLEGTTGNDSMNGLAGDDLLLGQAGKDTLYGGAGNDTLTGGLGVDSLIGGDGSDTYNLSIDAMDVIVESKTVNGDIDTVITPNNLSQYTLGLGIENGVISTGTLAAGLMGNSYNNHLTGNDGNNTLNGATGDDLLIGGAGDDALNGASGQDLLLGGTGQDRLDGGSSNDNLNGGEGHDTLNGGTENDVINGGAGNDKLTGGYGQDLFVFDSALIATVDAITDFKPIDDTIQLANSIFTSLTVTGALDAANFIKAAAAADSDDIVIYNKATGALYYDADGNGVDAAVQIATLGVNLNLTPADFVVI